MVSLSLSALQVKLHLEITIYNVKPIYLNVTQCGFKYHFAAPIWASYLVAQLVAFFWHLV